MILKGVGKMSESKTSVAPANSSGSKKQTAKMLGFGGFFAMTASMVMTVYAYPNFASSGLHLIFFLILGGVFWFLPVALVAAEMATVKGWENGGIFAWVGNTLGKRWGFSALFYQWFQITVGFVTMAFFVLAAISYIVGWDALYNNPLVMFIGVAIIVWGLTLTQLGGTKLTARIAKVGFFGGVLIPAVVLRHCSAGRHWLRLQGSISIPRIVRTSLSLLAIRFAGRSSAATGTSRCAWSPWTPSTCT